MTSSSQQAQTLSFDKQAYHEHVSRLWTPSLRKLQQILYSYALFNAAFFLIVATEIVVFVSLFLLLSHSSVLAFILALLFLTVFTYFILRLYFQAKRPETLMELCEDYLKKCKTLISYQEGIPEQHIALANAATRFAQALHEKEYTFYPPPFFLKSLTRLLEQLSAWSHWKDVHKMKEFLLESAVGEHIKVVKCEPTNLEVHAALANSYVMLSSIYADPRKFDGYDEDRWISPERFSEEIQQRFRATAERAIEEFKILNDYAPEDPWVHIQLAYSYHDLQMPEEEIREYETILSLRPNDRDTLFKLGMLYFQQGRNAQGLKIYEILKKTHYKKAESLIKFYGSFDIS